MKKLALLAVGTALPLMAVAPSMAAQQTQQQPQQIQQNSAKPQPQSHAQAQKPQSQAQAQQEPSQQGGKMNGEQKTASQNLSQDEIRQVQQALDSKGFNPGPVDGRLGPETKSALNQFQQKQGLQQTGTADEETLAALGVGTGTTGQAPSSQQPNGGMQKMQNQNSQGSHPAKQP
jgi:peptidoglycan hydrolase-like protein with peptidoglycan-binding domain